MRDVQTVSARVYLAPAEYVDSDHPAIRAKSQELCAAAADDAARARAIFYFVREILYHAADFADLNSYRASHVLKAGYGYCGAKASLFAALCRAAGLPARILFADVTNHISTPDKQKKFGTNLYAWHGYNEVRIGGAWLKVSPTFNSSLCEKIGVAPLEFDGNSDAILQAFDRAGHRLMSYDKLHGTFHDVPAKFLAAEMQRLYPDVCAAIRAGEYPLPK
ncbi:MAG: transglutaminase domain-containing protein [Proteobacteria bacterium]|nr:transglutaminase domain-containing protein [Pseudomonadota bacterium]